MGLKNIENAAEEGTKIHISERFLLAFSAAGTTCILAVTIYFCQYGFDFTDESFYVISLSDPAAYSIYIPVSLFGYIYHPLYMLLKGNVTGLRIANLSITILFAGILSSLIIKKFWLSSGISHSRLLPLSAAISTSALASFGPWLITPNYNTLAFQSLTIALIGLILLNESRAWKHATGWILIGLGGWFAFMAKPTTAAALALLIPLSWLAAGNRYWRPMLLAAIIATCLLFASGLLISGSATAFGERLINSIEMLRLLGSGQEFVKIFRIDRFELSFSDQISIGLLSIFIFFATLSLIHQRGFIYLASITGCVIAVSVAILIILVGHSFFSFERTSLFFAPLIALALSIACLRRRYFEQFSREHLIWGFLLLATPHIYAFGTNGNYWSNGSSAAFFWLLATLVLLSPINKANKGILTLIPVTAVIQLFTAIIVNNAIDHPYRQPHSLRMNAAKTELRGQEELVLSDSFHNYLSAAMRTGHIAGFQLGMPMLDLTGRSPGILYALGAQAIGQPWMVGAYPGSDLLATSSLDTVDCNKIAAAWVLEEPGGPRSLSVAKILKHIGADLNTDYDVVGSFKTAAYAGGHSEQYIQRLLKPTRTAEIAVTACLKSRKDSYLLKEMP